MVTNADTIADHCVSRQTRLSRCSSDCGRWPTFRRRTSRKPSSASSPSSNGLPETRQTRAGTSPSTSEADRHRHESPCAIGAALAERKSHPPPVLRPRSRRSHQARRRPGAHGARRRSQLPRRLVLPGRRRPMFRLDRIESVDVLEVAAESPRPTLRDLDSGASTAGRAAARATRCSNRARAWMVDAYPCEVLCTHEPDVASSRRPWVVRLLRSGRRQLLASAAAVSARPLAPRLKLIERRARRDSRSTPSAAQSPEAGDR